MRRHPVIFGILLLFLVGVFFFLFVYGLNFMGGNRRVFATGDKVGVVMIEGMITDSQGVIEQLDEFSRDDSVKAVVLRIDSPGGGVAPYFCEQPFLPKKVSPIFSGYLPLLHLRVYCL